jgi:hypothetical protein
MSASHFDRFVAECLATERNAENGLSEDELYGLYTSWCLLDQVTPERPAGLWAALKEHRIEPRKNTVGMTGPAAADYIMSSEPDLI